MPQDYPTPPMGENPEVVKFSDDPELIKNKIRLIENIVVDKLFPDFDISKEMPSDEIMDVQEAILKCRTVDEALKKAADLEVTVTEEDLKPFEESIRAITEGIYQYQSSEQADIHNDPRFTQYILDRLRVEVLMKKFGAEFYEEHEELTARKALETVMGEVKAPQTEEQLAEYIKAFRSEPLIPEIRDLEDKLFACRTTEEILNVAEENGVIIEGSEIAEMAEDAEKAIKGLRKHEK